MLDKTIIITGGNSGLGYECAKCIAASKQGWRIVIAGRSKQKTVEAAKKLNDITPNSQVTALPLDLASLQSVRNFVEEFAAQDLPPLRALVCNAGIQVVSGTTFTEDGFETTFGVNHLGHFLLANLLIKGLVAPARIVIVSSDTHDPAQKTGMPEPFYDNAASLAFPEWAINLPQNDSAIGKRRYTTSKLCNIYFTYELSRRLEKQGLSTNEKPITVNAFNPGLMPGTGLARDYHPIQRFAWNYILPVIRPISKSFMRMNSVHESGQALARLVLDPSLEKVSGKYYSGLKEEPSSKESYDSKKAFELWESSVEIVKLAQEETLLQSLSN
ncbi:MAG: SDR family NAD(P)-dependent oxidoreductase [Chloroflexota bacterium]|nr:SDR family NAD(P)-dependent oxidoreductase [Anaerolineales bacterium]